MTATTKTTTITAIARIIAATKRTRMMATKMTATTTVTITPRTLAAATQRQQQE